jgi:hypothetical protein
MQQASQQTAPSTGTPAAALDDALNPRVRHVFVQANSAGQMTCQPEELDITGREDGVLIRFHLQSVNWVFPATDAITVQEPKTQFPFPSWTLGPNQAALVDASTAPGEFQYTIHIVHKTSGQRSQLDPTIKNDF